jgi:hypothetical protein
LTDSFVVARSYEEDRVCIYAIVRAEHLCVMALALNQAEVTVAVALAARASRECAGAPKARQGALKAGG